MPSHHSAHAELRETMMSLTPWPRCPVPWCNKPCKDVEALKRHMDVAHPQFPETDEGSD